MKVGTAPSPYAIEPRQGHENEKASIVLVCSPVSVSKMMGSLHPAGGLYEKPVDIGRAQEAHAKFVAALRRRNLAVHDLHDILTRDIESSVGSRIALENFAFKCLKYQFKVEYSDDESGASSSEERQLTEAEQYYVSDEYKRMVIDEMPAQQLVEIIFSNPTITISPTQRNTRLLASYKFDPLTNIVFVRDQVVTTSEGVILGRLHSEQRCKEVDLMEFCLRKLGVRILGRVPAPGHLEGGDFFPLGRDLCLLGTGMRTNWAAAEYLMKSAWLTSNRVAIVRDDRERSQDRMHLDTVFSIISDNCCVMLKDIIGEESPTRRVVDEYIHIRCTGGSRGEQGDFGMYVLERSGVEFSTYMKMQGFEIIDVSSEEQLKYGCNVLNLGDSDVISIEKQTARRIASSKSFHGQVEYLNFEAVTTMYGGVHCASQVICREKKMKEESPC